MKNWKTYRYQRLSSSRHLLDPKIFIPRPTKCETLGIGSPLAAVTLYGTHTLGLLQVAWPRILLYSGVTNRHTGMLILDKSAGGTVIILRIL